MKHCDTCTSYCDKTSTCHLSPPQVFIVPVQGIGGVTPQLISAFPSVRPADFCACYIQRAGEVKHVGCVIEEHPLGG